MIPRFRLEVFEGPLDLLLHLIKKNEVDLHDIPIASITDQYMQYMGVLEELNLDLAGEYLVMAATLAQIKSRILLPAEAIPEEEEDPRDDLVQQLEEYARYREAGDRLMRRDVLDRDVFRRAPSPPEGSDEPPPLRQLEVGDLVGAIRKVLDRLPKVTPHQVAGERMSIASRIPVLLERLRAGAVDFDSIFEDAPTRHHVVVTFLALLELMRMRAIAATQDGRGAPIQLQLIAEGDVALTDAIGEEYEG